MVAEPPRTASTPSPETVASTPPVPALRYKYRLRFRKVDSLRLVSHHDLMHVFERMARRAELPIAHTQGFHPQPRMVFALSLALGIAGSNEVLDLELTESLDPNDLHARLVAQAPPGLDILSARCLEGKSSSVVRRAFYRLPVNGEASEGTQSVYPLPLRCGKLFDEPHLWVERSRPQPRRLDIRPYLSELHVRDGNLELAVWVTPTGTARPEEFARLLGLDSLLEAGAFFERTDLEMMDETSAPMPEIIMRAEELTTAEKKTLLPTVQAAPASARPTALTSGPMSFDT